MPCATASVRALHSHPADAAPIAAASALLVPQLLNDAMRNLSVLFGSTFYGSVEPYAAFEKLVRDLAAMSLVGLGSLDSAAVIDRAFQGFSTGQRPIGRRIAASSPRIPICRRWPSISSAAAIGRRGRSSVGSTMRSILGAAPVAGRRILCPR